MGRIFLAVIFHKILEQGSRWKIRFFRVLRIYHLNGLIITQIFKVKFRVFLIFVEKFQDFFDFGKFFKVFNLDWSNFIENVLDSFPSQNMGQLCWSFGHFLDLCVQLLNFLVPKKSINCLIFGIFWNRNNFFLHFHEIKNLLLVHKLVFRA